jgi:hypothetical protein
MKEHLGIMNIRSIKEAIAAANGFWTHYSLLNEFYTPLIGFDVDFIRKKEDGKPLEEKLLMLSAACTDSADIALCYPSPILNADEFFEGLKEVLGFPQIKRKTKAVYFSQDWPGISVAHELKFKFPNLKVISTIATETPESRNQISKNLRLHGKNIDCLAVSAKDGQKKEYESLDERDKYLELHDTKDQISDSSNEVRDFIEGIYLQELGRIEEKMSQNPIRELHQHLKQKYP